MRTKKRPELLFGRFPVNPLELLPQLGPEMGIDLLHPTDPAIQMKPEILDRKSVM